jgi:hypothetical protein
MDRFWRDHAPTVYSGCLRPLGGEIVKRFETGSRQRDGRQSGQMVSSNTCVEIRKCDNFPEFFIPD